MWARHLELAIGCWLAMSPFVFGYPEGDSSWANDLTCAAAVVVLALLPYWAPLRRAHLGELLVAAWLVGFGWFAAFETPTPSAQNHIVVGLLLGMLAIVPSRASEPPLSWRRAEAPDAEPAP